MAEHFPMASEQKKQWKKRKSRSTKKDSSDHDSKSSTTLFTQKMAYQSENSDGKFFIFSWEPSTLDNEIPSFSESVGGTDRASSHPSSPADSALPAVGRTRFINRSIYGPLHDLPTLFTLADPDPRKSSKSISIVDIIDRIESVNRIDTIDTIDTTDTINDNHHDQELAVATTPTAYAIMQSQVHADSQTQDNSNSFIWRGERNNSAMVFPNNQNTSHVFHYGLDGNIGNTSGLGPDLNACLEPDNGYSHNDGYGYYYGSDATNIFDISYSATPGALFVPNSFNLPHSSSNTSPILAGSVLGKRRHDDSDIDDSDGATDAPVASPLKRNCLQNGINYHAYTLHQNSSTLTVPLASHQHPALFNDIYRRQRLEEAMAAACGDTTADRHTAVAPTTPLSPSPGLDPVANVAAYFGRQSSSASAAIDLSQPEALDPMLGPCTMGGLGGLIGLPGLGGGLGDLGLNMNIGTTQGGGLNFSTTTTVPEMPPVYMNWPTTNMEGQ